MDEYLNIFIDKEYPTFIDKYLNTKTLNRIKNITQFCGCDYTRLYSPKFLYTRFNHSLVVAHMTWHFTHKKDETIAALLHDVGTPCFAHCIDYVFGDYINQESSEKSIVYIIKKDSELLAYLKTDEIKLTDLEVLNNYHILENKSPKLCTDRLDGVLHTCYIWLQTHSLRAIKEVYDNIEVLENEDGIFEIGFQNIEIANKFVDMVFNYATELQKNTDKYVMKYISEVIKIAVARNLISYEDLYTLKESEICKIIRTNFLSWKIFENATILVNTNELPKDNFFVSFETKKRNVIPLVKVKTKISRINEVSEYASNIYQSFISFKDRKYAYIEEIREIN